MIQIKLLYSKDEFLSVPLSRGHTNVLKTEEKRYAQLDNEVVMIGNCNELTTIATDDFLIVLGVIS